MSLFLAQVPEAAALAPYGMVIFLSVFVGMLFWVFRRNSKVAYERMERLPLEGD